MFSASFYKKPPSMQSKDRFIASQRQSEQESSLQHDKLMGFEVKNDPMIRALTQAEWGVSPSQINDAPIREFSLQAAKTIPMPASKPGYTLSEVPKLKAQFAMDNTVDHNPISWGENNTLYIATKKSLYSCDYASGGYSKVVAPEVGGINALSYVAQQDALLMGKDSGQVQMFSVEQNQVFFQSQVGHLINSIRASDFWHSYYVLANSKLNRIDIRENKPFEYQDIGSSLFKYGMDKRGTKLAISDSMGVYIYDLRHMAKAEVHLNGHKMPTKALAFAPHSERLLATGGGQGDETIKIWDLQTATVKAEVDTEREVCNLHWLDRHGLFATEGKGRGEDEGNTISCWSVKPKSLSCDTDAWAHDEKVLFSAQHPKDPTLIATASPDNKVKFWSVGNVAKENTVGKGVELAQKFQIR